MQATISPRVLFGTIKPGRQRQGLTLQTFAGAALTGQITLRLTLFA